MTTLNATYDGVAFKPDLPFNLAPNTRVRITIEPRQDADPRPRSFLSTARSLRLDGPADWSTRLDDYLYGEMVKDGS